MRIKITQDHIDKGLKRDCHSCPIAWAITEVRHQSYVQVGTNDVRIDAQVYQLPAKVSRFISNFDDGQPVKPFAFNLEI